MIWIDEYIRWMTQLPTSAPLRSELSVISNKDELQDRFARFLSFSPDGLHGVMAAGINRINDFTMAQAGRAIGRWLLTHCEKPSVAIAYDSHLRSNEFALIIARVFCEMGIQVYIYDRVMPVPALSFAVRHLRCNGGVALTGGQAGELFNGLKVYRAGGYLISNGDAAEIQNYMADSDPLSSMPGSTAAVSGGAIWRLGTEMRDDYLRSVEGASLLPPCDKTQLAIAYTPLHGSGISCVPQCLYSNGFERLFVPSEQEKPDGKFPTCHEPDPTSHDALTLVTALAQEESCDMVLATDPGCECISVSVRSGQGFIQLSPHEIGILLLDFICRMRRMQNTMVWESIVCKTITASPMTKAVAHYHGVELREVLPGFQYIGEQISLLEQSRAESRFLLGFDETGGYLSLPTVREKDAVNAALMIAEMALWYKQRGKTLVEAMDALYQQFGYYATSYTGVDLSGPVGNDTILARMEDLRTHAPEYISSIPVSAVADYKTGCYRLADGTVNHLGLPEANILHYILQDGSEVVLQPSVSGQRLELHTVAVGSNRPEAEEKLQAITSWLSMWTQQG